jgi:monoterpene epsilon-lactone hydrolase
MKFTKYFRSLVLSTAFIFSSSCAHRQGDLSPVVELTTTAMRILNVKKLAYERVKADLCIVDPVTLMHEPDFLFKFKYRVEKTIVFDRNVFILNKTKTIPTHAIFYIHGGAYSAGFSDLHWRFLSFLLDNLDCYIVTPDYPLAPTHTIDDAMPFLQEVFASFLKESQGMQITLMGDSAGAALCLALAQKSLNEGLSLPNQVVLLSPWLDVSLNNPNILAVDPLDPMLSIDALRHVGKQYAGSQQLDSYLISPLYGNYKGLPPISLFTGTHDILYPDARLLQTRLEMEGIPLQFNVYEKMFHVWMLLDSPESRDARNQILDLFKNEASTIHQKKVHHEKGSYKNEKPVFSVHRVLY